jgi:hypothetical protein
MPEDRETFTAYMDGVDFQEERGRPSEGSRLYATPEAVLAASPCSRECGVVEVEVRLVRWATEQRLEASGREGSDGSQR